MQSYSHIFTVHLQYTGTECYSAKIGEGARPPFSPTLVTALQSINGQCTNFVLCGTCLYTIDVPRFSYSP